MPKHLYANSHIKTIRLKKHLMDKYKDVYTPEAIGALYALSKYNDEVKKIMKKRMEREKMRFENKQDIDFLDPEGFIPGTNILVKDARAGNFVGCEIPEKLQRQWVQLTGPTSKPKSESTQDSIRPIVYQLLSGADGVMHDGEDAQGQPDEMSLESQRNLKLAIHKDPLFLSVAEQVAKNINDFHREFHGEALFDDYKKQLNFTTKIYRPRGLHLDDRHIQTSDGESFSAAITDVVLYVTNNYKQLQAEGSPIVLYLPKIQTAEEAALWNKILSALEDRLNLKRGTIKTYVLVEQVELTFQLMETRAALAERFVGYNTGRWDYINDMVKKKAWDPSFIHPNIEEINLLYPYMAAYEDRVRRATNTPDKNGNTVLWQGGMESAVPVGDEEGVKAALKRVEAGAEREQQAGASGKWASHWKMVKVVREIWKKIGKNNQLDKKYEPLTYTKEDKEALFALKKAPRTIRGVRNLISVALQYGNACLQGHQAAALKAADFFDDKKVMYAMEDAATGEIRVNILWEWLHKNAMITSDDGKEEIPFTRELYDQLVAEEYEKLQKASNKDVHNESKQTTLPIVREIVDAHVKNDVKAPWYLDLLNINLNNFNLNTAKQRILQYFDGLREGFRITENPDLDPDFDRRYAAQRQNQDNTFHFFNRPNISAH